MPRRTALRSGSGRQVPNSRQLPGARGPQSTVQGMRDANGLSISSICWRSVRSSGGVKPGQSCLWSEAAKSASAGTGALSEAAMANNFRARIL